VHEIVDTFKRSKNVFVIQMPFKKYTFCYPVWSANTFCCENVFGKKYLTIFWQTNEKNVCIEFLQSHPSMAKAL
jgi:hypothetical protein